MLKATINLTFWSLQALTNWAGPYGIQLPAKITITLYKWRQQNPYTDITF